MPDVATEVKNMGWFEGPRMADVRQYARQAQNQVETRNTTKMVKTEKELHLAAMTMYYTVGVNRGRVEDREEEVDMGHAWALTRIFIFTPFSKLKVAPLAQHYNRSSMTIKLEKTGPLK